jgi:hypothetical protein
MASHSHRNKWIMVLFIVARFQICHFYRFYQTGRQTHGLYFQSAPPSQSYSSAPWVIWVLEIMHYNISYESKLLLSSCVLIICNRFHEYSDIICNFTRQTVSKMRSRKETKYIYCFTNERLNMVKSDNETCTVYYVKKNV